MGYRKNNEPRENPSEKETMAAKENKGMREALNVGAS